METISKLHKVLKEEKTKFENNKNLNSHIEFYEELKKLGFIKKQEYSIPPVDTIGKRLTKCNFC